MSRKQRQPVKAFTGPLAKPIRRERERLPLSQGPHVIKLDGSVPLEWLQKIELLAKHYAVETKGPAGWGFMLALHLALDFVPGFQVVYGSEGQRGRPKKHDEHALFSLLLKVETIKFCEPTVTDLAACERVVTEETPALAKRGGDRTSTEGKNTREPPS